MAETKPEPRLITIEKGIAGAFFATVMLSIFLQVLTRLLPKFLGDWAILSLPWTEELSRFAFVWLLMLGASIGLYKQEHFSLTLFTNLLSPSFRWWCELLVYVLELVFIGFLIRYGYLMSEMVWGQISPALGLRYAYVYSSVPVGALLMAIHLLSNIRNRYCGPSPAAREA
jgi:TRAP-type C4-dicarboxylate transport system permease small subunit